jgi:hypothetical protein
MLTAFQAIGPLELRHLKAMGAINPALVGLGMRGPYLGIARAESVDGRLWAPSADGKRSIIVPAHDEEGALCDLIAFRSDKPLAWLGRTGAAWCLGADCLSDYLMDGALVRLRATPLDWLKAGGHGLCVVDWSAPEVRQLSHLANIDCPDARLASRLRSAIAATMPRISIGELQHAA